MTKVLLKPKECLKVFNPKTKLHLSKDGELITLDKYWRRMIICGDVLEIKEVKKKSNKKSRSN